MELTLQYSFHDRAHTAKYKNNVIKNKIMQF